MTVRLRRRPGAVLVVAAALAALAPAEASAGVLGEAARHSFTDYCSRDSRRDAETQDRLFRFAQAARDVLERSGHGVALVARSGLDLARFGQRYSHAGLALREGGELPWAIRQLYFDCEIRVPRLFDQGLAGFVMGTDDAATRFLSLVLLPDGPATRQLRAAALDRPTAQALVGERYSATAYALGLATQNCNQWLAELMGLAWSPEPVAPATRVGAQAALRRLGYGGDPVTVRPAWLIGLARWLPHLDLQGHPPDDLARAVLSVSLPPGLERLVAAQVPGVSRVELCQRGNRIVMRQDGPPLDEACEAGPQDTTVRLD